MRKLISVLLMFIITISFINAQEAIIEGYVFEEGNRGYLNQVNLNIYDSISEKFILTEKSNQDGFFSFKIPSGKSYILKAKKDIFEEKEIRFDTNNEEKVFLKIPLKREEGYIFEVTLAPKRENEDVVVDAITGALIEVYNNTTKEEVLVLENHASPDFKIQFKKGNHYTIMVRKKGFLVKRMEAFVNVEGCILCFEGVGEVRPGVTDNLTESMTMGTLLANVEMEPLYEGKIIELQNLYYDFGKATLTKQAKEELRKLANILESNPQINVELGSHTDVRGTDSDNLKLSEARAESAVNYLTQDLKISQDRIQAKGYGESQIKNKCKAGVDCTDEEHAENRRTEIKILQVDGDEVPLKSLASIIFEEDFMRKVLEGDVEQVNYMESEQSIKDSMVIMEVDQDNNKMKQEEVFRPAQAPKAAKKSVSIKPVKDKSDLKLDEVITERKRPNSPFRTKAPSDPNKDFSGYRIVVYFSSMPISGDNEIYDVFNDIITYKTAENNYLYMTGAFKTQEEADSYINKEVKDNYPNAYIVAFLKGKKISIE